MRNKNFEFKPYMSKKIFFSAAIILFIILNIRLIVLGFPFPNSLAPILFFFLAFLVILNCLNESKKGIIFPMDIHRKESPQIFLLSFIAGLIMGAIPIVISFIMVFFFNLS